MTNLTEPRFDMGISVVYDNGNVVYDLGIANIKISWAIPTTVARGFIAVLTTETDKSLQQQPKKSSLIIPQPVLPNKLR